MLVNLLMGLGLKRQARPDEPVRTGIAAPARMTPFGRGNPFLSGRPQKRLQRPPG